METLSDILVFKTNVRTESDKIMLKEILDNHDSIQQWNIDLDDIDCVLRVVTNQINPDEIIQIITSTGYYCEELE
jgi:hypothetical protein